jgi:hypothetical protein
MKTMVRGVIYLLYAVELIFLNHLSEISTGVQEQLGGSASRRRKRCHSDEEFVSLDLGNLFCGYCPFPYEGNGERYGIFEGMLATSQKLCVTVARISNHH